MLDWNFRNKTKNQESFFSISRYLSLSLLFHSKINWRIEFLSFQNINKQLIIIADQCFRKIYDCICICIVEVVVVGKVGGKKITIFWIGKYNSVEKINHFR